MPSKPYKIKDEKSMTVSEPAVAYQPASAVASPPIDWNPNRPIHATQEEWWEHIHEIEEGPFYPVSEIHQRISQWLDNQKR